MEKKRCQRDDGVAEDSPEKKQKTFHETVGTTIGRVKHVDDLFHDEDIKNESNEIQGELQSKSDNMIEGLLNKQQKRREKEEEEKRRAVVRKEREMKRRLERDLEIARKQRQNIQNSNSKASSSSSLSPSMEDKDALFENTDSSVNNKVIFGANEIEKFDDNGDNDDWEGVDDNHESQDQSCNESLMQQMIDEEVIRLSMESELVSRIDDQNEKKDIDMYKGDSTKTIDMNESDEPKEKKKRKKSSPRKSKYEKEMDKQIHQMNLLINLACMLKTNEYSNCKILKAILMSIIPQSLFEKCRCFIQSRRIKKKNKIEKKLDIYLGYDNEDLAEEEDGSEDRGSDDLEEILSGQNFYAIKAIMKWFSTYFKVERKENSKRSNSTQQHCYNTSLDEVFKNISRRTLTAYEAKIVCMAMFRALGFHTRLIGLLDSYKNEDPIQQAKKTEKKGKSNTSKRRNSSKAVLPLDTPELVENEEDLIFEDKKSKGKKKIHSRVNTVKTSKRKIKDEMELRTLDLITKDKCKEWIEVYTHGDNKWMIVDPTGTSNNLVKQPIHQNYSLDYPMLETIQREGKMSQELLDKIEQYNRKFPLFILAFGSNGYIQDITSRYGIIILGPNTNIGTKQFDDIRLWFEAIISQISKGPFDRENDDDCDQNELDFREVEIMEKEKYWKEKLRDEHLKLLPSNQESYKNHPLYILETFVQKYEGLYPIPTPVVGYCGDIPVYSRTHVHSLHTRERWLQEGKMVRKEEKAFKIVKASHFSKQENTELFGVWQCDDYKAPIAEGGIVPKNERKQVDLLHPSMMPVGCIQLKDLPGIARVAKKLKIDYAPCMTGFETRGGRSVPRFEGVVVCEEHEQILRDAYIQDEQIRLEKLRSRIEKRVYSNWKKLILGVLAKDRVMKKYGHSIGMHDDRDEDGDIESQDQTDNLPPDESIYSIEEI